MSRATFWLLNFSDWQILSSRFIRIKFRCCRCAVQQHLQSTAVSSSITQIIHFSEKKNFVEDSKCCLFGTLFLYLGFSIRTFCSVPVALPSCAALCCNVSTRVFHGSFILNYEDYRSFRKKELCWTVNGQCLHQFNHLIAIFCGPVLPFTSSAALSGRPVGTAPDIWVIHRKFTTIIEIVKQELCWRNDALQYDNFISSIMTFRAVDLLRSSLIDASSIFDFHLAAVRNSNNQRNAFKSTVSAVISIIRQSARYLDQLSVWNALANCPETAPSASITTWNCPGNGTELNNKKNIKFHRSIDWNGGRWLAHRAPNGGKFNRISPATALKLLWNCSATARKLVPEYLWWSGCWWRRPAKWNPSPSRIQRQFQLAARCANRCSTPPTLPT